MAHVWAFLGAELVVFILVLWLLGTSNDGSSRTEYDDELPESGTTPFDPSVFDQMEE